MSVPEPVVAVKHRPLQVDVTPSRRELSEARRRELYLEVVARRAAGQSARAIARTLRLSRNTVAGYLRASEFPARRTTASRYRGKAHRHADYIRQRWAEGCHSPRQLWRELQQAGHALSEASLWRWTIRYHTELQALVPILPSNTTPALTTRSIPLSPYHAAWLLCKPTDQLKPAEQTWVNQFKECLPAAVAAHDVAQQFQGLIRQRQVEGWDSWLRSAKTCALLDFRNFALGLERDDSAVRAALTLPYSNGRTEGHVHRLKLIKRSMFGRAKFDLLRQRVLLAP